MGADLDLRCANEPFIEVTIDCSTHLGDAGRAAADRINDLFLALQAMRNVLVDQRHRIVARRAVSRMDPFWISRSEQTQRSDVLAHASVWREDRRRAESEDRV